MYLLLFVTGFRLEYSFSVYRTTIVYQSSRKLFQLNLILTLDKKFLFCIILYSTSANLVLDLMIYHIAHIAIVLNLHDAGQRFCESSEKQPLHGPLSLILVSHLLPVNPFMQVQEFTILMFHHSHRRVHQRGAEFFSQPNKVILFVFV